MTKLLHLQPTQQNAVACSYAFHPQTVLMPVQAGGQTPIAVCVQINSRKIRTILCIIR